MRPRIMPRVILFSLCLLLVACRNDGPEVGYNFDKNSDFSKFRTYAWIETKNPARSDLNHRRIIELIDQQLAAKGFK